MTEEGHFYVVRYNDFTVDLAWFTPEKYATLINDVAGSGTRFAKLYEEPDFDLDQRQLPTYNSGHERVN